MAVNSDLSQFENLLSPIKQELYGLRQSLDQSDAEIDQLQVEAQWAHRPWYRDITALISISAFLLSLFTTTFSYYIAKQQEIENNKNQLRQVTQRLTALDREYNQLLTGEASQNVVYQSGAISTENIILASQAYELIQRIPRQLTPAEYTTVAGVLSSNGYPERAEELYLRAIEEAGVAKDKTWALQMYALFLIQNQKHDKVRDVYQSALSASQEFPSDYPLALLRNDMWTYLSWSGYELSQNQCSNAREKLDKASELSVQLALASNDPFSHQLNSLAAAVAACKG